MQRILGQRRKNGHVYGRHVFQCIFTCLRLEALVEANKKQISNVNELEALLPSVGAMRMCNSLLEAKFQLVVSTV